VGVRADKSAVGRDKSAPIGISYTSPSAGGWAIFRVYGLESMVIAVFSAGVSAVLVVTFVTFVTLVTFVMFVQTSPEDA